MMHLGSNNNIFLGRTCLVDLNKLSQEKGLPLDLWLTGVSIYFNASLIPPFLITM
jgi:hypothetical protein